MLPKAQATRYGPRSNTFLARRTVLPAQLRCRRPIGTRHRPVGWCDGSKRPRGAWSSMLVAGSPPRRTGGDGGRGAGWEHQQREDRTDEPTPGSLRQLGIAPTGALVAVAAPTSGPRPYRPLPPTGRLATVKVTTHGWGTRPTDISGAGVQATCRCPGVKPFLNGARGPAVISRLGIQRLASWAASQRLSVSSQEVHR